MPKAPFEPFLVGESEARSGREATARLHFWGLAVLNQERANAARGQERRPAVRIHQVVKILRVPESGMLYSCRDVENREAFRVSVNEQNVLFCWACLGHCCVHIVEALIFWGGQNRTSADIEAETLPMAALLDEDVER